MTITRKKTLSGSVRLVTGGWRSGASALALKLAQDWEFKTIITTQLSTEDDILEHIALYQKDLDDTYTTLTEGIHIDKAMKEIESGVCIIDDLATWVGNVMHNWPRPTEESYPEIDAFLAALKVPHCELIIVTREMNMGLPSDNITIRRYRDVVGRLNQRIASLSKEVWLTVSGIPLRLK